MKDGQLLKDKLIKKLGKLARYLRRSLREHYLYYADEKIDKLNLEIISLKKQIKEQESKPVYDENYLNECIEKATPNLSQIKDVDKELDEIRGIEEEKTIDFIDGDGVKEWPENF